MKIFNKLVATSAMIAGTLVGGSVAAEDVHMKIEDPLWQKVFEFSIEDRAIAFMFRCLTPHK